MTNVYDIFYVGEAPFFALGKKIWENCSFENVNKKMDTGNFLGNLLDCCSRQNNTPISYKKIYEAFSCTLDTIRKLLLSKSFFLSQDCSGNLENRL